MRQTLSAIVAISFLGVGCASMQETRMYKGPFGRTEVAAVMVAADPASSKVLVETYDGDLWIYDVDAAARGRLSSLRVGDEVVLAFDDRIAGRRAVAVSTVAPGRRTLPPGMNTVVDMLPMGVVFGAPAVPSLAAASNTVVAPGGLPIGATGPAFAPGVIASNGTLVSGASTVPMLAGPGLSVPILGNFASLPSGVLAPQTAVGLGLVPGTFVTSPLAPMGGPSVANASGTVAPGRTPLSQGNFTPGTIAPGVTTANPNAPGSPVVQGPFTPGTVAPGVSQQRGNAPPPAAGATTGGGSTTTTGTPRSGVMSGRGAPGTTGTTTTGAPSMSGTTGTTGAPGTTGTTGARGPTGVTTSGTTAAPSGGATTTPH